MSSEAFKARLPIFPVAVFVQVLKHLILKPVANTKTSKKLKIHCVFNANGQVVYLKDVADVNF